MLSVLAVVFLGVQKGSYLISGFFMECKVQSGFGGRESFDAVLIAS